MQIYSGSGPFAGSLFQLTAITGTSAWLANSWPYPDAQIGMRGLVAETVRARLIGMLIYRKWMFILLRCRLAACTRCS